MNNEQLITSVAEFVASQNIKRDAVVDMLNDVLRSLIEKKFGTTENFDIIINPQKGDLQLWRFRTVVADQSPDAEAFDKISLSEAKKIEPDFEIGEEVAEEVKLDTFGRRAIMQALQLFMQKKYTLEKDQLYQAYHKRLGKIISAVVHEVTPFYAILQDDEKNELRLPRAEQLPGDQLKKGEYVKAAIHKIEEKNNRVHIILSRTSTAFLKELLSNEIPEIADDTVTIKGIGRIPGVRSKVAVMSKDDYIHPVGACIGERGTRIQSISKYELANEPIDVIQYTDNKDIYIKRLMHPAKITGFQETPEAITLYMAPDQVPLAIGKKGQNIFLASQILGKPLHIDRGADQQEVDGELDKLIHILDAPLVTALKELGFTTVKSVLQADKNMVAEQLKTDAATIQNLYNTLQGIEQHHI